jgi:hypothetical protein
MSEHVVLPSYPRFKNLTGMAFGLLRVISFNGMQRVKGKTYASWIVACTCGKQYSIKASCLISGGVKSCGCVHPNLNGRNGIPPKGTRRHTPPELNSWREMIRRCYDPRTKDAVTYQGVKVCDRWRESYKNFLEDMGPRPEPKPDYSLDRIDGMGDYAPENCRWATRKQQNRNKRTTRVLAINGETKTVPEWCEIYGTYKSLVNSRVKLGWDLERAVTTPKKVDTD